jgi:polyphenol oxidase
MSPVFSKKTNVFPIANHVYGYFGNESNTVRINNLYSDHLFLQLKNKLEKEHKIDSLFFLKQTHSADVFVINHSYSPQSPLDIFQHTGDAIITNKHNCAIGVVTADCLPVILYDEKNEVVGVIHAGWKGLSAHVITATIQKMQNEFQTNASNLQAYLGPSAGVCCYEVQNDFLAHFPSSVFEKNIIEKRNEKLFFNQKRTALLELLDNQLRLTAINESHHVCTLCSPGFCSARIQKENAGRQPTLVFLQ